MRKGTDKKEKIERGRRRGREERKRARESVHVCLCLD